MQIDPPREVSPQTFREFAQVYEERHVVAGSLCSGGRLSRDEVPLRERAAGAGFEVSLKARSRLTVGELDRDDDSPRPMLDGMPGWPTVVPLKSVVDVRGAANIVP
jgi:hypothetical protein